MLRRLQRLDNMYLSGYGLDTTYDPLLPVSLTPFAPCLLGRLRGMQMAKFVQTTWLVSYSSSTVLLLQLHHGNRFNCRAL